MGFRITRDDGQEVEIDVARIIKLAWLDVSGQEQEVEGHAVRIKGFEQEPDIEGQSIRVTYLDDDGREQEVEGHYARYSDLRLKRDVRALRGVSWRWRDDAPPEARRQPGVGVIAQDVEAVFPELVTTGPDGIKRVDYVGLIGPLIEAVKELDARVRALEARPGEKEESWHE
jgi:endosialidase-like protein